MFRKSWVYFWRGSTHRGRGGWRSGCWCPCPISAFCFWIHQILHTLSKSQMKAVKICIHPNLTLLWPVCPLWEWWQRWCQRWREWWATGGRWISSRDAAGSGSLQGSQPPQPHRQRASTPKNISCVSFSSTAEAILTQYSWATVVKLWHWDIIPLKVKRRTGNN